MVDPLLSALFMENMVRVATQNRDLARGNQVDQANRAAYFFLESNRLQEVHTNVVFPAELLIRNGVS